MGNGRRGSYGRRRGNAAERIFLSLSAREDLCMHVYTFSFARAELSQGCDLKNRECRRLLAAASARLGNPLSRRLLLPAKPILHTKHLLREWIRYSAMGDAWCRCAHPHETKTHTGNCVSSFCGSRLQPSLSIYLQLICSRDFERHKSTSFLLELFAQDFEWNCY